MPFLRVLAPTLLLLSIPLAAAAQVEPTPAGEPLLESGLRVQGLYFENFFQLPDDADREDVQALDVEARLAWRPAPDAPLELFGTAGALFYSDDVGESPGFGVGVRRDARPSSFELVAELLADRPSLDVGDTFDQADVLRLAGEYAYRVTDDWQLSALGELQRQQFERATRRDNDFLIGGGAVRYRGWGYDLSPELGVEIGERDADDPNEDHDQTDLWLKLRSAPVPPLYLSLRLRSRTRDYSVADPAASNFGREDDRLQVALTADWTLTELLALTLYYAWEDADSTKPDRRFTTQLLALGTRWSF